MVGILQWLADARNGDHQAWEKLHRSLQPYLLTQAQRHLGPDWPERSVRDLIQDTWLRAMKNLREFKGGPDDRQTAALLRSWLKKIMRNVHVNVIRDNGAGKRKPRAAFVCVGAGASSDSSNGFTHDVAARDLTASKALSQTEEQARMRSALARLPNLEREVVHLYVVDSVSMADIATRLGLTYDVVRYRKDEGLRILGELLSESP
jgi:RNA polymerase sigma factor (sigma-70 family)